MWQIALVFYFIFGTASYLLRKMLTHKLGEYNRLVNAVFFIFFLLPVGTVLAFFFPHDLDVGALNILLLLGGSLIFPLLSLIVFKANKATEVGVFTIINNLSPLFTLLIALPFLHQSLTVLQSFGIGFLIFSGMLAATAGQGETGHINAKGVAWCLLSAAVFGIAIAYESFMLDRVDFGAYLVYGWGSQIAWSAVLAGKELTKIPSLFSKNADTSRLLLFWGTSSVLKSVAFILALKISANASLISAATNFLSVAVVITAYFFLKEREHLGMKLVAVAAGVAGLLLITV